MKPLPLILLLRLKPLLLALGFLLNTPPLLAQPPENPHVREVVERLSGVMDTSAQHARNPKVANVQMTTCSVELLEEAATFLYQEQALAENLNNPYRQRFLQILPSADSNGAESKSYKPLEPQRWEGLCDRAPAERRVSLADIEDIQCSVFLVPVRSYYAGKTQPGGCAANVRGAVRITNTVFLYWGGMDTWDRGYDADGQQVWGARDRAYQYRRATF